ncbi:hypothetical protein TL5120_01513 [Thalassovita autumnalis]|uniref:Uncharacterized protein n=1 Tax=Thalassovita autumnalis TaxID=2072972 RepID=A0A0P1FT43_9RHOB|nr:hypothetical protein TL5120_01513 [Thalassovita autumnalis]
MLPVIISTAQNQPFFGPDDLRPDAEACDFEAFGDCGCMQGAMPDVGDVAGKQPPGFAPVGPVIIQHLAGALSLGGARLVAPARVIFNTVWRICRHKEGCYPVQDALYIRGDGAVAAEQPVVAEDPEIAGAADRILGSFRHIFLTLLGTGAVLKAGHQCVEFIVGEARQAKVELRLQQVSHLKVKQVLVPLRVFAGAVVHDPEGPRLGCRQPLGDMHRRGFETELAGRFKTGVPG